MRLCPSLILAVALLGAPAQAATQIDRGECVDGFGKSRIAACTRIIDDKAQMETDRAAAYGQRGLAWLGKGKRQRASADISAALRIAPRDPWSHTALGIYRYLCHEDTLAIIAYDDAIRLSPSDNAYAYFGRGVARFRRGDAMTGTADVVKARNALPDVFRQFAFRYGIILPVTIPMPAHLSR